MSEVWFPRTPLSDRQPARASDIACPRYRFHSSRLPSLIPTWLPNLKLVHEIERLSRRLSPGRGRGDKIALQLPPARLSLSPLSLSSSAWKPHLPKQLSTSPPSCPNQLPPSVPPCRFFGIASHAPSHFLPWARSASAPLESVGSRVIQPYLVKPASVSPAGALRWHVDLGSLSHPRPELCLTCESVGLPRHSSALFRPLAFPSPLLNPTSFHHRVLPLHHQHPRPVRPQLGHDHLNNGDLRRSGHARFVFEYKILLGAKRPVSCFDSRLILRKVTISLSADPSSAPGILFPERRIVFRSDRDSIIVGRASKASSKGFIAAIDNAWFDSPVMSRHHAKIVVNKDQKVCRRPFQVPACPANNRSEGGDHRPRLPPRHVPERRSRLQEQLPLAERRRHVAVRSLDLARH